VIATESVGVGATPQVFEVVADRVHGVFAAPGIDNLGPVTVAEGHY